MFYEGMTYVIRLCDGSFVILYGGASDDVGVEMRQDAGYSEIADVGGRKAGRRL